MMIVVTHEHYYDVPGDANVHGSAVAVEVTSDKRCPLDGDCRKQHVEADGAEAVAFKKRHQKAESDKYHHVNILEHWNKGRKKYFI